MAYPLHNWQNIPNGYHFGQRTFYNSFHIGLDKIVPVGTPLIAPSDGGVVAAGSRWGELGYYVLFYPDGLPYVMRFGHLSRYIRLGSVYRGEIFALSGNTGWTTGPHVHCDISHNTVQLNNRNNFINPEQFNWFDIKQDTMFIRRQDGQISILTPDGRRYVLTAQTWEKLGRPYAPTWTDQDYNQYPEAATIQDITL